MNLINDEKVRGHQGKINTLVKEMRSMVEASMSDEGKQMTSDQWDTYNRKDAEVTRLDQELQAYQKLHDTEDRFSQPVAQPEIPQVKEKQPEVDDDLAYRGWKKAILGKESRDRISGEERNALQSYYNQKESRASLQVDDLSGGGYNVVPERFLTELLQKVNDSIYFRGLATNLEVLDAVSLGIPTLESNETDASWQGEVATVPVSTNWVFGKRELYPHLSVKLVKASRNYIRNASQPVADWIQGEFARLFGETEENSFLTGSGSQQPLGVFTASSDGISTSRDVSTGNSTTAIVANNLIEVAYSLKESYFNRSTWIGHRDWVKKVRLLKDDQGQYLWQAGIAGNRPNTIIDRPYKMSEFAPNTFTASQYVAVLGDFKLYYIATALDMQLQVLQELYSANNQVGFIGRMQVDGMPIFEEAFARSQMASS